MNKRSFCQSLALSLALGAPALGAAQTKTEVVFAHVFPANSLEHRAAERFAKQAEEASGGKLAVKLFPASQLGGFAQIANQQRSGAVHVTLISTTALGSFTPVATVDSWPFMFSTREQMERANASDAGKAFFAEIEKQSGYRVLSPMYKGVRYVYLRRPANDVSGQKIRVPGLPVVVESFKAWNASPTPMDVAEIYAAMQQGVVDGIEIEVQTAASMGLPAITQAVLLTQHMMPNYGFIFFGKWLDGLPADQRKALEGAASSAATWFSSEIGKGEREGLAKFEAAGAKLIKVDTEAMRAKSTAALEPKFPALKEWVDRLRTAAGK
jgi:TRAP-type C4-dicarboxylate transport system substrate-binding protein